MERIARGFMLLCLLVVVDHRAEAQLTETLTASLDADGFLVLEGSNVELFAVEFRSASGSLVPSEVASPFQGVLLQDDSLAVYYNLGTPLVLDGAIRLDTQWNASLRNDVLFQYGTRDTDFGLQPIVGHRGFGAEVSLDAVIVSEPTGQPSDSSVEESEEDVIFTAQTVDSLDDAWLVARPQTVGIFVSGSQSLSAVSMTVSSVAGLLSPVGGSSLIEFGNETSFEVTYSATNALLRGDGLLPVAWSGNDLNDLTIRLTTANGQSIAAELVAFTTVPEPAWHAGMMAAILAGMAVRIRQR